MSFCSFFISFLYLSKYWYKNFIWCAEAVHVRSVCCFSNFEGSKWSRLTVFLLTLNLIWDLPRLIFFFLWMQCFALMLHDSFSLYDQIWSYSGYFQNLTWIWDTQSCSKPSQLTDITPQLPTGFNFPKIWIKVFSLLWHLGEELKKNKKHYQIWVMGHFNDQTICLKLKKKKKRTACIKISLFTNGLYLTVILETQILTVCTRKKGKGFNVWCKLYHIHSADGQQQ